MTQRKLLARTERWAFKEPFVITGHTFTESDLLYVELTDAGAIGRGEAAGAYYRDESGASMLAELETVRDAIEAGADRSALQNLLPPGGARNALDCALWDLEAKQSGRSIWDLTGIEPRPTHTVLTIGIATPDEMGAVARTLDTARIKVKLNGELALERLRAVREARPDAELVVDVNQGWTLDQLRTFSPRFADLGVAMIEQPLPRGGDSGLEGYRPPVPVCADESCLDLTEFEQAARRYQVINIKLDKCGGLTEALQIARRARERGIDVMVGNMMGTSLAIAPGFVVAQLARFVDLDGPLFLTADRKCPMSIRHGEVTGPSSSLWG
ncbi:MAG: N-acetyl-D-Glu racemase DgcA [Steroidobacteraceae bacterium]